MQTPADIFGEQGALSGLIDDYSVRPEQVGMAESIQTALEKRESLICEAGTGTGKTFAYLVPAILSGRKVIVSTATRHLQDQLFVKDLPLVRKAIGRPLKLALLKGLTNYLCLYRLKQAESESLYPDDSAQAFLPDIRGWSRRTASGDLAELLHVPEDAPVRRAVCISNVKECLRQNCDFYEDCFVFRARRRAIDADLVVVNHHLFLTDMVSKGDGHGGLLPDADVVVFDEAHKLPELASQFFSETLGGRQLLDLASDSRAAYFEEAGDLPDFPDLLDHCEKAVRDLRLSFPEEDRRLAWSELKDRPEIAAALSVLLEKAEAVVLVLDAFSGRGKRLDNCYERMTSVLNQLRQFDDGADADQIQWLELRGSGFFLHQTPLNVAGTFQKRMREYECLSIFTSATLSVGRQFDHFSGQLGLAKVNTRGWDSPFDFRTRSLLYLPRGLPEPRESGFTETIIEKSIPVLRLSRGRAFFLFTSHRALQRATGLLRDALDYPILVQGDAPRSELLETFRNTPHAVLLGTGSFWEGVDVRGQALSCVIIDKLPFAPPDDPVLKARLQQMKKDGRSPFLEYQVPEAVLALKQGIGRLLRDRSDYGVLMICDPRLRTKFYGKIFLGSLPDMEHTEKLDAVEAFFRRHEG